MAASDKSKKSKGLEAKDADATEAPAEAVGHKAAPSGGKAAKASAARRPLVFVAVIFVSVVMVGSVLLPSLSAIVSGMRSSSASTAATSAAATTQASTETATNTMLTSVNSRYSAMVATLEDKLGDDESSDAGNAATLINLANDYAAWASAAKSYASSDDELSQVMANYGTARDYYERYLKVEDAPAARTSAAMCLYYLGDEAGAISELEALAATSGDYAPAWYYLGTIYQGQDSADEAIDAFNKALTADPNDSYGLKSKATQALSTLESAATSDAATTDAAE